MLRKSLKFKVSLYLTIVLVGVMFLFIVLLIRQQGSELLTAELRHVTQLSQVIAKSTRYAMLLDEPEIVDKIIEDIGKQEGIKSVRVISKEGRIAHSYNEPEVGKRIDKKAEACVLCHEGSKPLAEVPSQKTWRIFKGSDGVQLLGNMQVIRNEPSCSNASCHEHPKDQTVLGVVDITYSLDVISRTMGEHVVKMIITSIGFILLVSISVGWLLHRLIYVPLKDLETSSKRVASGDFDHAIPVRGDDEFGRLARSSNLMMTALKKSRLELEGWVQTLEQKVKERTQELTLAEAEIARGEKLASIGQLAAGIAHELNNPLTGVLTFTSLLRKKMSQGSQDAEDLDLVINETKRCASIIRRLLDFAREKVPEKKFVNLNLLVGDTVKFVERSAALQKIEIATDFDPDLPAILVDSDLIKQVVMNVLVNAKQAIEENGSILVRTRFHHGRKMPKTGNDQVPVVELSISDTGCGIPEADLQRIFDPFFTSKEVGKGTGLGLSVSYGIVKSHDGEIKVESTLGEGTTFRIYLPADSCVGELESNMRESIK